MPRAYIAVGSNIRPEENVKRAVKLLMQRVKLIAVALLELDPGMTLPDTGEGIREIAGRLGTSAMRPLTDHARELRMEIANGHG